MSGSPEDRFDQDVAELRRLHVARARAEIESAHRACPGSDVVPCSGDVLADVMLLKGRPGPAEAAGGHALEGADGDAARKALDALGWDPALVFSALSRPDQSLDPGCCATRVRLLVEAVDPRVVVALDEQAAIDLAAGFGIEELVPGVERRLAGRRLLALSGLEGSLGDERKKRQVWRQLRAAAVPGPSY